MKTFWARVKGTVRRLRYTEPALLRARAMVLLGMAASLGITLHPDVDHWVGVIFAALTIAAPYYQGRKTRADVWSQRTVDDLADIAELFPGLVARARDLLGKGMPVGVVIRQLEQESLAADPAGAHALDKGRSA